MFECGSTRIRFGRRPGCLYARRYHPSRYQQRSRGNQELSAVVEAKEREDHRIGDVRGEEEREPHHKRLSIAVKHQRDIASEGQDKLYRNQVRNGVHSRYGTRAPCRAQALAKGAQICQAQVASHGIRETNGRYTTVEAKTMDEVRVGVIGVGGMGTSHAMRFAEDQIGRARLTAVCDTDPRRLDAFGGLSEVATFADSAKLIRSGRVDAVVIATPHYDHTTIGIDALEQGLHTLVEKPISVHKADCERLIAAHTDKRQVFAAMFNQRTDPTYRKVRELIQRGELGEIIRVSWVITNWFRTEAYYASGGWRATWQGEGGGVLLNQCPHNLDLLQWLTGMPARVTGFCNLGKRHTIEVEDEVTAYLEYPNGATGTFITSTGEAPGENRLTICGERGKLVVEESRISFTRTEEPVVEFLNTSPERFAQPATWNVEIPVRGENLQHVGILRNFVAAILDGSELIAPAAEGIHSVELANAMLYSSLSRSPVTLPLDASAYEEMLRKLISESTFEKQRVAAVADDDMASSFMK